LVFNGDFSGMPAALRLENCVEEEGDIPLRPSSTMLRTSFAAEACERRRKAVHGDVNTQNVGLWPWGGWTVVVEL